VATTASWTMSVMSWKLAAESDRAWLSMNPANYNIGLKMA
jgi:hypothetical protein